MEPVSVDKAIDVLNRIHSADPSVLSNLIFSRVPCNEELANDPSVQVGVVPKKYELDDELWEVGLLGIINGIFGVDEDGYGYIAANFDPLTGYLSDFSRLDKEGREGPGRFIKTKE